MKKKGWKRWKCGFWRKTTRTSWTERKRNDIVLQEIGEERNIITTITKKKVKFIEHLIRHNILLQTSWRGRLRLKDQNQIQRIIFQRHQLTNGYHLIPTIKEYGA